MANICETKLVIFKDDECEVKEFNDDVVQALKNDILENVVYDDFCEFSECDGDIIEVDLSTRWNVPADELSIIAKKHDVKIRAVGVEPGVGFVQVVCVDQTGTIIQNEEIGYKF